MGINQIIFQLLEFLEIGVLKTTYNFLKSKFKNKFYIHIFLGHSTIYDTNIYLIFNISTQSISLNIHMKWIKMTYLI